MHRQNRRNSQDASTTKDNQHSHFFFGHVKNDASALCGVDGCVLLWLNCFSEYRLVSAHIVQVGYCPCIGTRRRRKQHKSGRTERGPRSELGLFFSLVHFLTTTQILPTKWDADRYQEQHDFVFKFGSSLVDQLDPQVGERVLDLGCGTGELTHEIARRGARVVGIDADANMIETAAAATKTQDSGGGHVDFGVADARSFGFDQPFDAIFSNAALHWVPEAERAVRAMSNALKPGGRLVAEFGGKGNVDKIVTYLTEMIGPDKNPWYFPSIAEYSTILESNGLEVTYANLYDRPTPLNEGEDGLRNWILMFAGTFLEGLSETDKEELLVNAETSLREDLHNGEHWFADYRRLRIIATKREETCRN